MTFEEWQNNEIRNRINEGTATDADFDTLAADESFDRNWLGPQGQANYDAALGRRNSQNNNQTTQQGATEPFDKESFIKKTRSQFANDNDAYKAALAAKGINRGNSTGKVRGIQQAYYDGTIDKGTRDYMMADAIAKFARNAGRDIGNIGAQYTGGAINNSYEEADWNKRNDEMFKQRTSAEAAAIDNSDKAIERKQQELNMEGQGLSNKKADISLDFSRKLKEAADRAYTNGDTKTGHILSYLASKGANELSYDGLLAALGNEVLNPEKPSNFESDTRKEYPLEQFKQEYPNASDEDYEKFVNSKDFNEALKFAKELEKREKDIKNNQEKEEKNLKKQQKQQEADAKVKSGYANSYNNIIRDLENGNRDSLSKAWSNFASGRNPFDKNSFIEETDRKAITDNAKQILAKNGQNWLNQDRTPSDVYMTTVLKLALDNL